MRFRLLGPVAAESNGSPVTITGIRERRTLAVLLLARGYPVSIDRLAQTLWGGSAPVTVRAQVHNSVASVRRQLGIVEPYARALIERHGTGYAARTDPDQTDFTLFERQVVRGSDLARDGRVEAAAEVLRAALRLWNGPALDGLGDGFLHGEAEQLEKMRLACLERRIECELVLGRHHELVAELARLVAEHPEREGLVEQHMLALHRSGMRQDALGAYAVARSWLAENLGLDPQPSLRKLHRAILRSDPNLLI